MITKIHLSMAVVVRDGAVLIQKRHRINTGFVFEFPGGSVDADESPEEAAIRELGEETGMPCSKVLGKHTYENDYGGNIYFVILMGIPQVEPMQVDPSRQQTFYWFNKNNIPTTELYSADVKFIETCLGEYI